MDWVLDLLHWIDPAWITALIALIVGSFTVENVRTARRAYLISLEDRKKAQARLVWATVGVHCGKDKGAPIGDMGERTLGTSGRLVGDHSSLYMTHEVDGGRVSVTTRGLTIHVVRVTNNSSEPISRVALDVSGERRSPSDANGVAAKSVERYWRHRVARTVRVIPPGETRTFRVVVPVALDEMQVRNRRVTIRFTDSAGHRWTRADTSPPKSFEPAKGRPRFHRFRIVRSVLRINEVVRRRPATRGSSRFTT